MRENNLQRQSKPESVESETGQACCTSVSIRPPSTARTSEIKRLAALANATRLHIIEMLAELDEPLCVCDITAAFNLGQPTISHHLRVLRDAGLVTWEKHGLWVYYSLERSALEQVTAYLSRMLAERAGISNR